MMLIFAGWLIRNEDRGRVHIEVTDHLDPPPDQACIDQRSNLDDLILERNKKCMKLLSVYKPWIPNGNTLI